MVYTASKKCFSFSRHKPNDLVMAIKGQKAIGFLEKVNRGKSLGDTMWEEMANGIWKVATAMLGKSKGFGPKGKKSW